MAVAPLYLICAESADVLDVARRVLALLKMLETLAAGATSSLRGLLTCVICEIVVVAVMPPFSDSSEFHLVLGMERGDRGDSGGMGDSATPAHSCESSSLY